MSPAPKTPDEPILFELGSQSADFKGLDHGRNSFCELQYIGGHVVVVGQNLVLVSDEGRGVD